MQGQVTRWTVFCCWAICIPDNALCWSHWETSHWNTSVFSQTMAETATLHLSAGSESTLGWLEMALWVATPSEWVKCWYGGEAAQGTCWCFTRRQKIGGVQLLPSTFWVQTDHANNCKVYVFGKLMRPCPKLLKAEAQGAPIWPSAPSHGRSAPWMQSKHFVYRSQRSTDLRKCLLKKIDVSQGKEALLWNLSCRMS